MAQLTQVELNKIRELMAPASIQRVKYSTYAEQAQDQQIKQIFQQMANCCDRKYNTFNGLL